MAVHPIERLRYVARSGAAPDRILVAEAVPALSAFASNPGAMLVALRQLISRQPESPGLLVLAARVLTAIDPIEAAWELADELEVDPGNDLADELITDEAGGLELVDSVASGPGEVLVPPGRSAWIRDARSAGRSVVVLTPLGTRLPKLLWRGFLDRNPRLFDVGAPHERVSIAEFDEVVGPGGIQPAATWSPDCSDVAEMSSF